MDSAFERTTMRASTVEIIYQWLHRVVALYCLFFGILYWTRLIGLYDLPNWRFDLMPIHWQVAAVSLAALFPLAASGLWMFASWGPVIWAICAITETVMYIGLPDLFGYRPWHVAVHGVAAVLYMLLRFLLYLQERRREE